MRQIRRKPKIEISLHVAPVLEVPNQRRSVRDVFEGSTDDSTFPQLTRCNCHLVATEEPNGRFLAALAGSWRATASEEFMLIEPFFIAEIARDRNLMRRMLALALLHVARIGPIPQVVACCTSNPAWLQMTQQIKGRLTKAFVFPEVAGAPINLDTVRLARRIAKSTKPALSCDLGTGLLKRPQAIIAGIALDKVLQPASQLLVILDLRSEMEESIINAMRLFCRNGGFTQTGSADRLSTGKDVPHVML